MPQTASPSPRPAGRQPACPAQVGPEQAGHRHQEEGGHENQDVLLEIKCRAPSFRCCHLRGPPQPSTTSWAALTRKVFGVPQASTSQLCPSLQLPGAPGSWQSTASPCLVFLWLSPGCQSLDQGCRPLQHALVLTRYTGSDPLLTDSETTRGQDLKIPLWAIMVQPVTEVFQ